MNYDTDDNPRDEKPKKIRNELSKYISKIMDIGNRALVIKKAIQSKSRSGGDNILIAGKGHEKQIYKNKIINISDKEIVKKIKYKKNL